MIANILAVMAGAAAVAMLLGARRWKSRTRGMRDRLEAARIPMVPPVFDSRELAGLPAPVQRYFRRVLEDGMPMIAAVSVEHVGTFNMSEGVARWMPFTSTQRVVTRRPGFDWDARIAWFPGIPVRVHDAYVAGEGILRAAVFGIFNMANLRDTGELARGELIRFLAEAAWYPTALLPSQGVRWEEVDGGSARATLVDGDITVTLLFSFHEDGLIDSVLAEARGRTPGVSMPWRGRFWNHHIRNGMRVPLEAEVAWLTPEGAKPYWRGRIIGINYEWNPRENDHR